MKYMMVLVALLWVGATIAASDSRPLGGAISEEKAEAKAAQKGLYSEAEVLVGAEPRRYYISKINVFGVEMFDNKLLTTSVGLNEGDSITLPSSFIGAAIDRLWNQRRYSDVDISATIMGDNVELDLFLEEQPRVFNWGVEGISSSKKKDLLEKLKLRRNSALSDYTIQTNVNTIKEYYSDKGFRNTDVDVRIVNDTINDRMVNVTFVVDLNKKVKIGEVVFEGNEVFEDKRLRATFRKTNQKSINIFKNSKFSEDGFEEDKDRLIDFYNSRGYRNATIISDSLYRIDSARMGVKLTISEGNKYFIRNITWTGNSKFETEQLQQLFGVYSGDSYDKKTMHKRLGVGSDANPDDISVLTLYQNDGYLMSSIDPAEIIIGADSIDLELKIFEGKPYTINNVEISGNMKVDDEVIRRELYTRPGELYNRSLLMQTIRTLGNLGHFNPEAIMPNVNPVTNNLVDIGWGLEEQASDQFNIAGGWGSGSFVGSIGVTLNNIAMRDFFKPGAWRPYPMGQNQRLSVQAQTNGTYYKALSASLTDPWLGGKKPNSFTVTAHYSDQNDAYYAWQESTMYFRTFGMSVGLGKRLTFPDPYFSLYTGISYERYMLKDWTSFLMEDGDSNKISATLAISRNSIDQQLYPRRGSEFSASVQFTPPYSLFNGIDYSDDTLDDEDRYRFLEFHKWSFKYDWYQCFMKNSNLVLKISAEMGYLGHYNKDNLSPFERFQVGGDGMSGYNIYGVDVISLRGYEDGALDPYDEDYSMAYNKYTIEMRYPLIMEPSSQIYGLVFLEGGNGFSSWREFSPFNIKRSAGVGVRLYLPIVGLLGFDYGYGFDPASGSSKKSGSQFHFVMGQTF
ncbi:MAG: outer membrane protein assembly factor BamA [Rikenellaceae bacterium]